MMLSLFLMAAPSMLVIREADAYRLSTAYRISDAIPAARSMEFRKRILRRGAAIGLHRIDHDEVYYVLSGKVDATSDGAVKRMDTGMAVYLNKGAVVGIRQAGKNHWR